MPHKLKYLAGALGLSALLSGHAMAQQVELTFWDIAGNQGRDAEMAAFEAANPDIKVNMVTFESEDYKTQLRLSVAGGTVPDLYVSNGGFTFFEYVDRGAAMDITDLVKQRGWDKRTEPEFLAADTDKNGHVFGMPWNPIDVQALFYDKEFFDKNNIPLPTSIESMKDVAAKIKAAGRYPIAFGDKDGWPAIMMLADLMFQNTTPAEVEKLNTGENKWTDFPAATKAFDALHTLATEGAFMPGFLSSNHETAIMTWVGRKAAMLYNGTWWPSVAKTNNPFPVAVADFPEITPGAPLLGTQGLPGSQLLMSSHLDGAKKDAAIKLFDYLTSDAGMVLYGNAEQVLTDDPVANKQITQIAAFYSQPALQRVAAAPKMQYLDHAFPIPVVEVLKVQLQKIMQDDGYTTAEALAAVEAAHAIERAKN